MERAELQPNFDDIMIDRFAAKMKAKMKAAREKGRGGWFDPEQCSSTSLVDQFWNHLLKTNDGNFVDLANYLMMLEQRQDVDRDVIHDKVTDELDHASDMGAVCGPGFI